MQMTEWAKRAALALAMAGLAARPVQAESNLSPAEVKEIAEEAYIYGFPMVMNYGTLYEYFIDKASPAYKAPMNELYNTARVYTPADTTIVTPNSDTPYSFICMDLRAEPYVLTLPAIEASRYYSVQLIDLYTFNYGYAGSRTTGNGGGRFLIAGPHWTGAMPAGIDRVFRCETEFTLALIRTQMFNPADLAKVKQIQASYHGQTLSAYLQQPAPPAPPVINWPKIDKQRAAADPFTYLSFVLQFCPPVGSAAVEQPMRERFAKIGLHAGQPFSDAALSAEQRAALAQGIQDGLAKIKQKVGLIGKEENGWLVATRGFGDRAMYQGDWTMRAAAAMAGIYGNTATEALYPMLATDHEGNKPDTSRHRYTLTFPKGQLPPAKAFWSVTMYDGKTQLLVDNPIERYLINSPMLPDLKTNADGSLTLYLQKDAPPADQVANWLPAPNGPIFLVMRLYWPKPDAISGSWQPPAVRRVE